ncbi:MAG: DUF4091 domain-containing protein [Planctomycetota bacterium]|nr:DUF4091 domain-containing protein [Planctomycetota bacterium]
MQPTRSLYLVAALCDVLFLVTVCFGCCELAVAQRTGSGSAAVPNLMANGGFEEEWNQWNTDNPWYEEKVDGQATGISSWALDDKVVHSGKRSARVVGAGNRGVTIQVLKPVPGKYRVRGWVKCDRLEGAVARVYLEYYGTERKWLQGIVVGEVSGTKDWTLVEKEIEIPGEVHELFVDLVTGSVNRGTAWFDDLELVPVRVTTVPSVAKVMQRPANSGEVSFAWEPPAPTGIRGYDVFVEPRQFTSLTGLTPKLQLDRSAQSATVATSGNPAQVWVAVVPVMVDGQRSEKVTASMLTVRDTVPPRPGALVVFPSVARPGSWYLERRSSPLDADIRTVRLYVSESNEPNGPKASFVSGRFQVNNRVGWLRSDKIPRDANRLGIAFVDEAGNESEIAWDALTALPAGGSVPLPLPGSVWVTSSLHNVFRDTPPPAPAAESGVELLCARNETECAQVVVTPRETLTGLHLELEPLTHNDGKATLAVANLEWHFVGYQRVETNSTNTPAEELVRAAPGDFPDPFLDERSLDAKPGENQPIFLRVAVPADATPGVYRGAVHVVAAQGSHRVPVQVEVLPVTLPDRLPLFVTSWFRVDNIARFHNLAEWSEDHWRMLRVYAREMRRVHHNMVLTRTDMVKVRREPDGTLSFDFTDFDRWVQLFDAEGVADRIQLSHVSSRTTGAWECPTFTMQTFRAIDVASGRDINIEVEQFLPALERHLEEKGWLDRSLLSIGDEPIPENVASWREQSARAHKAAPKLKRIEAIHVPAKDVAGHLEVLVPPINFHEQWLDGYRDAEQAGAEVWFYVAWFPQGKYPNRLIDYASIKTRLIHWANYRQRATGYLHWGLNFWTDFKDLGLAPGDNWIVYPGRWGPRSSLRWEAQRDGLEDFAILKLLSAKSPARADELTRQVMRSATDYDKNPATLEQTRRSVLRELAQ